MVQSKHPFLAPQKLLYDGVIVHYSICLFGIQAGSNGDLNCAFAVDEVFRRVGVRVHHHSCFGEVCHSHHMAVGDVVAGRRERRRQGRLRGLGPARLWQAHHRQAQRRLSFGVRPQSRHPGEGRAAGRKGAEDRRDGQHRRQPGAAALRDPQGLDAGRSGAVPRQGRQRRFR